MFRVALIQNQSEMAHYGYADARPLITNLGYEVALFTADNMDTLGVSLSRKRFDAVVFGSNALNDKTIRAETLSDMFCAAFRDWLSEGRGVLSLHQLRLAQLDDTSEASLGFLPPPLDSLTPVVRPLSEKSADGEIAFGPRAENHVLLLYPHQVDPIAVKRSALGFRSLPALYWHSWRDVNFADWDVLLVDPTSEEGSRPLLLAAREPRSYRVVASALTLDWQNQRPLLDNILTYIVEGRHNTAVLLDETNRNTAFDYLIGTLQSRKYPFKQYFVGHDHSQLIAHIKNSVHNVLLLGPFVALKQLSDELSNEVRVRVASGSLKLVAVEGNDSGFGRFSVAGRERLALRLLQDAELRIQAELRSGYIDGSFWSTAETLQILNTLSIAIGDYHQLATRVLELANEHDRDGSYDEVFGVTCAFLWMRGKFLGVKAADTVSTANWIRARIEKYDPREQVLAYLTLSELGLLQEPEQEALVNLLNSLSPETLSEIDLLVYLRATVATRQSSLIPGLVSALDKKQSSGAWVDLATTATSVTTLLDVLDVARDSGAIYGTLKPKIERMVFGGIIYIQDASERSTSSGEQQSYPWDGKASTTMKCVQAWLKFEELIELPIQELVATLEGYDQNSTKFLTNRQALSVLEDLKQDNNRLQEEAHEKLVELQKIRELKEIAETRTARVRRTIIPFAVVIYLLTTILVASNLTAGSAQILDVAEKAFVDGWAFHLAFVAAVAASLAVPWRRWFRDEK